MDSAPTTNEPELTVVGDGPAVQVVFRIEPASRCLLNSIDEEIGHVRLHGSEGSVNCDIVIEGGQNGESAVLQGRYGADADCQCTVFSNYDVVPHVLNANSDSFDVALFAPSPEVAREVFGELESKAEDVQLLRYDSLEDWSYTPQCTVDLSVLTSKQRQSMETAFDAGYYDNPRKVTLETLADAVGVTTSAFASRLRNAERNILNQVFTDKT